MKASKVLVLVLVCNLESGLVFSMECPVQAGWVRAAIDCVFGNVRANLMFFDDNGDPALHAYIRQGDLASIQKTLERADNALGRNVVVKLLEQKNSAGKTPLQVALECDQQAVAQVLRQYLST